MPTKTKPIEIAPTRLAPQRSLRPQFRPLRGTEPVSPEAEAEPEAALADGAVEPQSTDNPRVIAAATQTGALPLDQTCLIGTVGAEGEVRALLRDPRGAIVTLKAGDRLGPATVTEVAEGRMVLSLWGRIATLTLPAA